MAILFFAKGIDFQLAKPRITTSWIKNVIRKEEGNLVSLDCIFTNDKFLAVLNSTYLGHKTLTDIITFGYSEDPSFIQGEIYISIERVKENAKKFKEPFDRELHRVIIHGVLHLLGYNDKTATEKAVMREKEEAYLSLR